MTKNTYMYKIHICKCKNTPGLSRCIFARGCIFAHVQINFYIYAIAFTCPKMHPGANYTHMYNLHTVCKSAHVNGALDSRYDLSYKALYISTCSIALTWAQSREEVVKALASVNLFRLICLLLLKYLTFHNIQMYTVYT